MASRPPMPMWICGRDYTNDSYCNLDDFDGRNSKTIIPHSAGRSCVGLTCGYLVLCGWGTKDYWLVNPVTRDELYFPALPCLLNPFSYKPVLVFLPSINEWVFVVLNMNLYYSIAGERVWKRVPTTSQTLDLHAFKGKIYTLNDDWRVCELRLNPEPKLTLLDIKNFIMPHVVMPIFISSDENLYVIDWSSRNPDINIELDFGEMKWVWFKEKAIGEYAFIQSAWRYGAVFKPGSWPPSKYRRYDCFLDTMNKSRKGGSLDASMWYFPHDCLNLNRLDE